MAREGKRGGRGREREESHDRKILLLAYARRAWRNEMMIGAALTTRTVAVKYTMFLLSSCLTAAGSGRLWANIFFVVIWRIGLSGLSCDRLEFVCEMLTCRAERCVTLF